MLKQEKPQILITKKNVIGKEKKILGVSWRINRELTDNWRRLFAVAWVMYWAEMSPTPQRNPELMTCVFSGLTDKQFWYHFQSFNMFRREWERARGEAEIEKTGERERETKDCGNPCLIEAKLPVAEPLEYWDLCPNYAHIHFILSLWHD